VGEQQVDQRRQERVGDLVRLDVLEEAPDVGGPHHDDATRAEMIWRVVSRYAELAGRPPAMPAPAAYAVLDGVFQAALLAHLGGRPTALEDLTAQVHALMPLVLGYPGAMSLSLLLI